MQFFLIFFDIAVKRAIFVVMEEDLKTAVEVMRKGGVILYPTDTIWGIGCDATNAEAVDKVYKIKKRANNKAMLVLVGKMEDVENYVYKEMVRKLREGQSPATYTKLKENPQVKQIYREIEEMEKEISLLVDSLAGAGETLTDYINQRVEEIDQIHQLKLEKLSVLAENHATPEQMEKVASNISLWGEIDFEEKRFTVDKMIRSLKVFPGSVQIQWKF